MYRLKRFSHHRMYKRRRGGSLSSLQLTILVLIFLFVNTLPWVLPCQLRSLFSGQLSNIHPFTPNSTPDAKILPSSPLRVHFTGRSRLWTLKTIIERGGFSGRGEPTVCPSLPESAVIPWNESSEIGMVREFLGGMYHPTYCRIGRQYYLSKSLHKTPNQTITRDAENNCGNDANWSAKEAARNVPKYAYVMMVSNHRYLDGAIVLADSIREHSHLSRSGGADVVLIINEYIHEDMFPLLQVSFDRVQIFKGLQQWAERSAYKATFDKIYLYMMEDYTGGILFLDADSLIIDNPDYLLHAHDDVTMALRSGDPVGWMEAHSKKLHPLLKNFEWKNITAKGTAPLLFAVGNTEYFQTGLMVLQPSLKVFFDLLLEFRIGSYGYNRWQARDGILFRTCFVDIGKFSRRPPEVHHFSGTPKPWFNLERVDKSLEKKKSSMVENPLQTRRNNMYFFEWWTRYELLHLKYFIPIEMEIRTHFGSMQDAIFSRLFEMHKICGNICSTPHTTKYGGEMLLRRSTSSRPLPVGIDSRKAAHHVSPSNYMWLMRFNKAEEYLHPTRAHVARLRTGTFRIATESELHLLFAASLKPEKGPDVYAFAVQLKEDPQSGPDGLKWSDCNAICGRLQLQCEPSLFLDTRIVDCQHSDPVGTMANGLIRCKRCIPHYDEGAPFVVFREKSRDYSWVREAEACFFNAWTRFAVPRCDAPVPQVQGFDLAGEDSLSPVCACR